MGSLKRRRETIMTADRDFVTANSAERVRLQNLVRRLTDAELAGPMPGGWTVAGVLGHLAYWDQRILTLLERCDKDGRAFPEPIRDDDVDWINDAGKPMLLALPPRAAADLTVAIAEAVDARAASVSAEFLVRNAAAGSPINLDRAHHRRLHLDEIERALRP